MSITAWFLMVSILLNTAFLLGVPIWLFVRFLIRRTKWWIVGQGSNGVDIREGRPKNGYYKWAVGKKVALVVVDGKLLGQARDGRPVLWVDTDSMTQILPKRLTELEVASLPKDQRDAIVGELSPIPGFTGKATNDNEKTTVPGEVGRDGKSTRVLSYPVWQRISGWRLYKAFTDIRIAQLNESNAGMWATIERLTPILAIVAIIMLIIIMTQLANLG